MGELNSARGKELARRNITNSNDASFIRSRTYKRIRNRSMGKKRKENLDNRYLPMPLFPGRQPSKSKMKQKHFQFNKPKVPLLYTRGMERNKKCASSNLARRESLVQRSHSPIYFNISQKLAVHLEEDSICNSKVTKMCSTLQQPSQPTSSLACKGNEKKRKMPFDTSPTLICPVAKKRSAHQPSYDIRSINCQRSNSDGSKCYAFGIRIISPTHDGINEASRKLRSSFSSSGIVSIPTEKEYALLSYVPFQKPTYTSRTPQDTRRRAWDTMSTIRLMKPSETSVYLQHPIQAYNFVAFSNHKTFMYKESLSSNGADNPTSIERSPFKITFSESHEVLNRLSSAFWPGTVTIFAPVRTRRLKNTRDHSTSEEGVEYAGINGHDSMASLSSITSLASEESEDSNDGVRVAAPSIPVVPDSVLCSEKELHIPGGGDENTFIGMRCPSHPIAKKILSKTYAQEEGNLASPLKGAIIGMNIPTSEKTCRGVCAELQSFTSNGDTKIDEKPIINVMNGEDCCEMFSVPPCQFGELPSVSLVIDTPRRNIVLLRKRTDPVSNEIPAAAFKFDVRAEEVKRVLCNLNSDSVKARVIAAVMSKWSITEFEI